MCRGGRVNRCPVSGGEEKERSLASSLSGSCLYDSRGNVGCLVTCVGVDGDEASPEAFLDLVKNLMPPGEVDGLELGDDDSLEEDLKIPLKLILLGVRGGDSWYGKGNTVFGEPGLCLDLTGADTGLEGRF